MLLTFELFAPLFALGWLTEPAVPFQVINFEGEMLLQGAHDHVDVVLLKED
jgi:hypothetical protein